MKIQCIDLVDKWSFYSRFSYHKKCILFKKKKQSLFLCKMASLICLQILARARLSKEYCSFYSKSEMPREFLRLACENKTGIIRILVNFLRYTHN